MERVGNSNAAPPNLGPLEPGVCETPKPEPVASCPDGAVAFDQGVCAKSGLKGPPTAAERYAASLFEGSVGSEPPAEAFAHAPQASAAHPTDTTLTSESRAETEQVLRQLVHDAGEAVIESVRSAVESGSFESGRKYEYQMTLPNGCKGKFAITAAIEKAADGKPEFVAHVSGGVEGQLGLVSASLEFTYAKASGGHESLALGACVFGGVAQEAAGLFKLEAKAGVCATIVDTRDAPATLEVDAVVKAEAGFELSESWTTGYDFEARRPISREPQAFDLVH